MMKATVGMMLAALSVVVAPEGAQAAGFGYELEPPAMLQEGNGTSRVHRVPKITDDLVLGALGWGSALAGAGLIGGSVAALTNCEVDPGGSLGCVGGLLLFPLAGTLTGYIVGVPLGVGLEGPHNAAAGATLAGVGGALTGVAVGAGVGALTGWAVSAGTGDLEGVIFGTIFGVLSTAVTVPMFSVLFYEAAYDAQFDVAVVPTFQPDGGGLAVFGRF